MEDITKDVNGIEASLSSSRIQLRNLEKRAKISISSEVDTIRTSLKSGGNRIETVTSQTKLFLTEVEDIGDAEISVDMKPQITWLHDNLQDILEDFNTAQSRADGAIATTKSYTYNVMDVAQEVESNNQKLAEFYDMAEILAQQAQSTLKTSESLLEYTRTQIQRKEKEIAEKSAEVASKNRRKAELESEIHTKEQQAAAAERERKSRKEDGLAGLGLSIIGVLAAPVTGGGSLALTAAGMGLAGYKAKRMEDFATEAEACRQAVTSLNAEISRTSQAMAQLRREKERLLALVSQYQDEVSERRTELRVQQKRINEAMNKKAAIGGLKDQAATTKANILQALPDLQNVKASLEQCSTLIHEKSLDVSGTNETTARWSERVTVLDNVKKSREFKRQRQVILQVSETLERVSAEVPRLLPSSGGKFLDIKPWNSAHVTVMGAATPIPDVRYHNRPFTMPGSFEN